MGTRAIARTWVYVSVALLIVGVLLVGACVREVPVERVVTQEVIKEVPVEKVVIKEVPQATTAPTSSHKTVYLEIRGAEFGGTAYIITFALADIINKKHPWIRAAAMETFASVDNIVKVGADPKKQERTIIMQTANITDLAWAGAKPFEQKYPGVRHMLTYAILGDCFVTLDPNIKAMKDLAGKKVITGAVGSAKHDQAVALLRAAGIADKVQMLQLGVTEGKDVLLAGNADAQWTPWTYAGGGKWVPLPYVEETRLQKKVYPIPLTEAEVKKVGEVGYDVPVPSRSWPIVMKANSVEPGYPSYDVRMTSIINGWGCWENLSEEIVYEVMKTIDENRQMFKAYHASGESIAPDIYGAMPHPADMFHPGAVRYYREKGIKFGPGYYE